LRCRSATTGRLRPGVQILAPRFREDLCLDAGLTSVPSLESKTSIADGTSCWLI
jgi:hypothetical protein